MRSVVTAIPGVLVIGAALAGWCPTARDLPTYFLPLRERTAEVVTFKRAPFWNPDTGCGEPYFANPQTGVLYPPAWLAAALPGRQALGVEVGLHLALLGIGAALLAARLGAKGWMAAAAGLGVALSGPVASSIGVLNNLDTLAWAPWLWWAALAGMTGWVAVFLALAYLGGEPQVAAVAALVAFTLSPRRGTAGALLLGAGLVAVQALPFVAWVAGGDRGAASEPAELLAGAILPGELPAVLLPGAPLPARLDRFVSFLAVPAWGLLLAIWALAERRAPGRLLAIWGWVLIATSVLAGMGWAGDAWGVLTLGLVRYPGRLLFLAVPVLLPAAAAVASKGRGPVWVGAAAAGLVAALGFMAGAPLPGMLAQAACAAVALFGGPAGALAAIVGSAALATDHWPALALERRPANPLPACLLAQQPDRVYAVQPSWEQIAAVREGGEQRAFDLGWGYTALLDGRAMVRTFAPLASRALAAHLAEADRGPAGRWWLNTLAAPRLLSQHPIAGFPGLCRDGPVHVMANPQAWPEASVVKRLPRPGEQRVAAGEVLAGGRGGGGGDRRLWRVQVEKGGGIFLWLATPDRGWSFTVDGTPAKAVAGSGIMQGIAVPGGDHRVEARYRPRWLLAGGVVTLMALVGLLGMSWRPEPDTRLVFEPPEGRTAWGV